ncbi:Hypothetical_protein [Hexamita inflata]|uniref:Hypothetical_protein n=1 Tax=Hexamita inflata TaxID=28002 RepID=A0AA86P0A6_9EUKA|nr:Hypothetical protein HINF_LOCUS17089 [Hexamita inflata]
MLHVESAYKFRRSRQLCRYTHDTVTRHVVLTRLLPPLHKTRRRLQICLDYPILYIIIIIRVTRRPLIMRDLERRPDGCANEDRRISRAAGTYSMHSQVQSIVARPAV